MGFYPAPLSDRVEDPRWSSPRAICRFRNAHWVRAEEAKWSMGNVTANPGRRKTEPINCSLWVVPRPQAKVALNFLLLDSLNGSLAGNCSIQLLQSGLFLVRRSNLDLSSSYCYCSRLVLTTARAAQGDLDRFRTVIMNPGQAAGLWFLAICCGLPRRAQAVIRINEAGEGGKLLILPMLSLLNEYRPYTLAGRPPSRPARQRMFW